MMLDKWNELFILPGGLLALAVFITRARWKHINLNDALTLGMLTWVEVMAVAFFFEDISPTLVRSRTPHVSTAGAVLALVTGLLVLKAMVEESFAWGIGLLEVIGCFVFGCALLTPRGEDYLRGILSLLWTALWLDALFTVTSKEASLDLAVDSALDITAAFMGFWLLYRYGARTFSRGIYDRRGARP